MRRLPSAGDCRCGQPDGPRRVGCFLILGDEGTLAQVCPNVKDRLTSEYDFGDSRSHIIVVEKIGVRDTDAAAPVCLAGRRASPPEDCGGPWGYADMLEAIGEPKHEMRDDLVDWIGVDFDPERFDTAEVNALLNQLSAPRGRWSRR